MSGFSYRAVLLAISVLLSVVSSSTFAQAFKPPLDMFSEDTVLVKFRPGTPANSQADAHRVANGLVDRQLAGTDVLLVRVPPGTVNQAIAAYDRNPNIEYAEKNFRRVAYFPTTLEGSESIGTQLTFDQFDEQWNLHNTGQEFGLTLNFNGNYLYPSFEGVPNADINAPEGWGMSHGSSAVSIAILDTGVVCDHLDLAGKCSESVSFVDDRGSPLEDVIGHGSHVAGIAAAITNNGVGIAGVGWDTSVAAVKVCWEDYTYASQYGFIIGVCDDADAIEGINHSVLAGHQVISMSFAGSEISQSFNTAVDYAWNNGVILVAAAGNTYTDDIMYPAGYTNVISIGSTDHHDNLSAFSNHGVAASVLAPGSHIVSTVPGQFCGQAAGVPSDCYDTKSGTSMAAPHVAGLAALMVSEFPTASNAEIRDAIESTADITGAMGQNMLAWSLHGRINMQAALATDPTGPTDPGDPYAVLQQPPVVRAINVSRGRKLGQAEVTVVDNLGNAVSNADVSGEFSGSFSDTLVVTTDNNGVALFDTDPDNAVKGGVSFSFCVTSVVSSPPYSSTGDICSTF